MLIRGDVEDIIDEHLRTGYENYKELSGFEGILLMDLPTETSQYFTSYDDMIGLIKNDAVYIYGPEGEMMPKVSLQGTSGGTKAKAGKAEPSAPAADLPEPTINKRANIEPEKPVGDVGRKKRR